jgi:hypothetical protein
MAHAPFKTRQYGQAVSRKPGRHHAQEPQLVLEGGNRSRLSADIPDM